MKWVIGILDRDTANKIVYVTSVDFANKTYEVETGKDAAVFEVKASVTGIVAGIIAHGKRAVLIDARCFYDQLKNESGLEIVS